MRLIRVAVTKPQAKLMRELGLDVLLGVDLDRPSLLELKTMRSGRGTPPMSTPKDLATLTQSTTRTGWLT